MNLKELRNKDPNYLQIQASLKELILTFEDNYYYKFKTINRKRPFFILDFIQTHYGLEIFELQKGDKFEEKMNLMSSSFQIAGELNNIYWFLIEGEFPAQDIPAKTKKNKNAEEISIIYKFSKYLVSKNQSFFYDSENSNYCMTFELNQVANKLEDFITEIMISRNTPSTRNHPSEILKNSE